jgi:hypothetical protein
MPDKKKSTCINPVVIEKTFFILNIIPHRLII